MIVILQTIVTYVLLRSFLILTDKKYEENEEEVRKQIFAVNVKHIKEHNQRYSAGEKSYYLGVNQFTDMVRIHCCH